MFEKESKEYAIGLTYPKFQDSQIANIVLRDVEGAFQKGAELAYSKFNEWHYPSNGELPKDDKDMLMSKTLLLITKMKGSDCLSLALGQYNFSTQEFSYQHIVGLTDVIAWKEIVLPSEPMRSFDEEEQKNYTEAIKKVYKPTGVKLFDKESE